MPRPTLIRSFCMPERDHQGHHPVLWTAYCASFRSTVTRDASHYNKQSALVAAVAQDRPRSFCRCVRVARLLLIMLKSHLSAPERGCF